MAEFIMKCPHCQNDLQVEDEWIGMNVDCPLCSQTFTVQKSPTKRSKNNSRTSSTPKYYCSSCKKEYPKPVKFCSECGSAIKTKSSNGAQSTQSGNLDDWTFYNWFWVIAILIGVPVLLTMWINWPRTIFWCTLPLWGVCLGMVASEFSNKLAILLFAGIIWWGWWAHTRVEIPTPEQTVKTEESKQMAKAETPAQMVKIASHSPAATSAQAKQNTNTPTPAPAATSEQANNTSSIDEKKSPPLEFLGISVNESKENIEAHLRKRGFEQSEGPITRDKYIENAFRGDFWLLSKMTMTAYVGVESGKIRIIFDKQWIDMQGNGKLTIHSKFLYGEGTQADIMIYNKLIELENKAMQQYFNVLQEKYGKAQMRNNTNGIIKLKDGLIELDSSSSAVTKGFDRSLIILNKYSKVIFYNRQAAQERLLEIEKANADLVKRGNDI